MIIRGDEPIFIIRRTEDGVDKYGNPTYTTQEILIRDALFAFGATMEPVNVERNPIDAKLTLYLPHGTLIEEGDLFEIRETLWEKDGDPAAYPTIDGFEVGVVVNVRRRRG